MIKTINIHGNEYVPVSERLRIAHEDNEVLSIETELLDAGRAIVKATVTTSKGIFSGISAANPDKSIEKQSPYEVAETSAVGRALGFAGYGVVDSIASADEMVKAVANHPQSINAAPRAPQSVTGPSEKQVGLIKSLMEQKGYTEEMLISEGYQPLNQLTGGKEGTASELIDFLFKAPARVNTNGQPVAEVPPFDDEDLASSIPF
jgi:ribosomal protein S8